MLDYFLLVFVWCLTIQGDSSRQLLAVFRPRSSHTSLMHPLRTWSLPLLEFTEHVRLCSKEPEETPVEFVSAQCLGELVDAMAISSIHWEGFEHFRLLECDRSLYPSLIRAASRCVLLHGLYEVIYRGHMDDITSISYTGEVYSNYSLTCTVPNEPWLSKRAILEQWNTHFDGLLHTYRRTEEGYGLVKFQIFGASFTRQVMLCTELHRGMSAPVYGNQGGRDPLPLPSAMRRPMSGVLNTLATRSLLHRGRTSLEPELGLLMCGLAGVRQGSAVLDPFCGMCSLLIHAAYLGADTFTGVDASEKALQPNKVVENFKHLGLSPPSSLYIGSAEGLLEGHLKECARLRRVYGTGYGDGDGVDGNTQVDELFDCLVTDPPYGMQESIALQDTSQVRSEQGAEARGGGSAYATHLLLRIAVRRLRPGGRAVFLLPQVLEPGEFIDTDIDDDHSKHSSQMLREIAGFYQPQRVPPLPLHEFPGTHVHVQLQ
jgi:16S rRNA G966 N2-methylase RsmD